MRPGLAPAGAVVGSGSVMCPDTDWRHHRRRERTSPIRLHAMNTVSPYRSRQGVPAVRHGERDAGSGWWSKRMPGGNRRDRGCAVGNITPRESGPTSTWSLGTRLGASPSEGGRAAGGINRCRCGLPVIIGRRVSAAAGRFMRRHHRTIVQALWPWQPPRSCAAFHRGAFERLEPDDRKRSRPVLGGVCTGNGACLPDHPSGDPTPSPEDAAVTAQVIEAGKLLDVDVLDRAPWRGGASCPHRCVSQCSVSSRAPAGPEPDQAGDGCNTPHGPKPWEHVVAIALQRDRRHVHAHPGVRGR